MIKEVRDIVHDYLEANHYDGLEKNMLCSCETAECRDCISNECYPAIWHTLEHFEAGNTRCNDCSNHCIFYNNNDDRVLCSVIKEGL